MLGLLLDAAVILGLVYVFNNGEVPGWGTAIATAFAVALGFIALVIFTVVSLIRRGSSGWAWVFWGVVFSIIGLLLYTMATCSGSGGGGGSAGGGSFGGGSFGGGSSGGGGASGSW